ncbi:uncharacterized protein LOC132945689 [Metopolophium dirhodum]|uniref:uncharacterized protein LOC132945689 n=1 Tax=Metopolophium dirhodum TaxID=44670 RepID=UPI0029904782|nr:uncharacterized protein LOC132945689 [Metopolophium dirhodum]
MEVLYTWIIYPCLIFGSSILCDGKLEIQQAVSSPSEDIDDMFYCSNGLRIEWSSVCDGHKDCFDGLDEMKELCARYEYGTNISMDCGTVSKEIKSKHSLEATPWVVDIYKFEKQSNSYYGLHDERTDSNYYHLGLGTIISPNVVIAAAQIFWDSGIRSKQNSIDGNSRYLFKIDIPQADSDISHYYIDAKIIYLFDEARIIDINYQPNTQDLAVIVLANKISFSNVVTPVCIDWHSKYNVRNGTYGKIAGFNDQSQLNHLVLQRFFPHIENSSCLRIYNEDNFHFCIRLQLEERGGNRFDFQSLSFLQSNSYFLTGITSCWPYIFSNDMHSKINIDFIDIKNYIPWIRGILNKHSTANSCVLPAIEGVVYSYEGSHSILSPLTSIDPYTTVIENCEVGYHKANPNGFRVCQRYGTWKTDSDKLCLKMCPPLLSDSLDIKCSYNGNYTNCSNASIPHTIATLKCKPTYTLPNGHKETPLELQCQSNGLWDNQLYKCEPASSCVLPTVEGVVYTYDGSNESLSHGTLIDHGVTVNENCTFGYHNVYPDSFRVCQRNGKWKPALHKLCLKMCPPLLSDSLDIQCSYNGKYANCSNLSIPDTIAIPKCKPAYVLPNGQKETPIELHCMSNGIWNNELYICEPECGRTFVDGKVLIANGKKANIGTAPWNVAIYEITNIYNLICGGSIISRNLVVSAAHCFSKSITENITTIVNVGLYKIAVGKYDRNFRKLDNEFTKIMNVDRVHLKEAFFGLSGYYAEDIAVVVLQNSVSFSNGITPICMDWYGDYKVSNGDEGKIVGWGKEENGISSPVLLETRLPYIDMRSCRSMCTFGFKPYVTHDKICAGSSLVSAHGVDKGDSGSGLCFLHSNLYYLTGVVSLKDPDANNSISLFTSVNIHIHWIRGLYLKYHTMSIKVAYFWIIFSCLIFGSSILCDNIQYQEYEQFQQIPPTQQLRNFSTTQVISQIHEIQRPPFIQYHNISRSCVLPDVEGVVYTYEDSNESLSPGTLIDHGVTVNENCIFGYYNVYPNSFRVCQRNGKWKTALHKLCLKMCPPLLSDSLDIQCSYNGKYANCSNLSIPDTIAIPKCKPAYNLPNGQKETPIELHCMSNGIWNNELRICEPDCGKPFIKTQILIKNGKTANVGTAPWYIAIYKKKSNYEFLCGGSIISRNLVVSAAHCFWKIGMPYNITIVDDLYKIVAGKYYRNFEIFDIENPQIINVDRVHLNEAYYGLSGYYAEDIAVVVLQNSVSFSYGITPICMDWNGDYKVSNGDEGKIVGWGKTENGNSSPVLLETRLPYIDMRSCRNMCTLEFKPFVTHDKICAGSSLVSEHSVDPSDSGAGLCFSHSKLYYLTGVVSLKDVEANNSIVLFTSVQYHIDWIRRLYIDYMKVLNS